MRETGIRAHLPISRRWVVVRGAGSDFEYWTGADWSYGYSDAAIFEAEETAKRVADELRRVIE